MDAKMYKGHTLNDAALLHISGSRHEVGLTSHGLHPVL